MIIKVVRIPHLYLRTMARSHVERELRALRSQWREPLRWVLGEPRGDPQAYLWELSFLIM